MTSRPWAPTRAVIANPYVFALLALAVAHLVQQLLGPHFGPVFTFVPFYFGVMVAAWRGGLRPALFAMVLGYALAAYYFIRPGSLVVYGDNLAAALVYVLLSLSTGLLTEFLQKARRHVEEARERLRVTLSSIADAVVATDALGKITSLNAAAQRLTGWTEAEALGRDLEEVFCIQNTSTGQRVSKTATRIMQEGHAITLEKQLVLQARSGATVAIEESASPILDTQGDITGLVIIFRDVTQKRRAEEYMEQFRAMFELAGIGMVQADPRTGQYLRVNPKFSEMTGYSADELLRMNFLELTHPEDRDADNALLQGAVASKTSGWSNEKRYVCKDGRVIWVHVTGTVSFADKQPIRTVAHIQDITQRRLAEESLRASEQRFRTMADSAPVMIWLSDAEKQRNWFSRPWLEFTGREMQNELGTGWATGLHPDDAERCQRTFEQAFDERQSFRMEYRLRRCDGGYRWVLDQGIPLHGAGGEFLGYIGSAIDINEKTEAAQSLKEADRRKDEFLAMLAHELRNPLATIQYANYISRMPQTQPAGDGDEFGQMIDDQVKHLARLIDDLLDVSRITQDKIDLKPQAVDAVTVVQRAIAATRPLFEARQHTLEVEVSERPMPLLADPTRLEQVVQNLLNNAAKYTPTGGRVRISARPEASELLLLVEDNGAGMPRELIPKVFELFTQGERTLDRSDGGLGIGLTLVRKLVEMHGGSVSARSEGLGHGSQFTVRLPLAGGLQLHATEPGVDEQKFGAPLRILVVEDNVDSARGISLLLRHAGHEVAMCHSGLDVMDLAKSRDPDVLLLDIGLPGRDGYQVARDLRRDEQFKGLTIIALSGYGQARDRELSREAGFDHHLVKPVDFSLLLSMLAKIEPKNHSLTSA